MPARRAAGGGSVLLTHDVESLDIADFALLISASTVSTRSLESSVPQAESPTLHAQSEVTPAIAAGSNNRKDTVVVLDFKSELVKPGNFASTGSEAKHP